MAGIARITRAVVLFWSLLTTAHCFADTPVTPGAPRWACWYAPGIEAIHCLLVHAPEGGYRVDTAVAARARQLNLPETVQAIWGNPSELSGYRVSIPVWTPPVDMAFARELAESVMCGSRADCSVIYDANDDGRGPLRAAALEAGVPESEVLAELATRGLAPPAMTAATVADNEPPRRSRRRRFFSDATS